MAPLKVLLIDDYQPFIGVLRSLLPEQRFLVVGEASDGLKAVEKAVTLRPDLVLLDIGLPKLNGIEVTRAVKKRVPDAAVLVLSQDSSAEISAEALAAGALGYVHKPRVQRDLLKSIESVLAKRQCPEQDLLLTPSEQSPAARAPKECALPLFANSFVTER